jgi:xylan 1,4-beta-xylosidase
MNLRNLKLMLLSAIFSVIAIGTGAQTENPILPGFYPDPSFCRVDNDYYLVNSSFSFFPGIPIFHSTDLAHWKQIGHVLDRPSQLKLTDHWMSAGIYAPSISYHKGTFYLITTLIGSEGGNFYVTAENPAGPWSDPNWLREIEGIDPDFFFDEDGKVYIVNNGPVADGKPLYNGHRALWLQEFDLKSQKIIGKSVEIVNGGTDISKKPIWIEGPHIFNKNGYYYLLCAEGGTGVDHSQVIFRSRDIWGPYEVFEGNPILTQRDMPEDRANPVTSTGHADFVQTPGGDWVAVYLGCQPYEGEFFNTGRQTFIQNVDWSGEWPIILEKGKAVPYQVTLPLKADEGKISFREHSAHWKDEFNEPELKLEWNFIRTPQEKWYSIDNGILTINARPISIDEVGNPSFIGRRLQHANAEFSTSLRMQTEKGNGRRNEMEAGIVAFQNEKFFYKMVVEQQENKHFIIVSSDKQEFFKTEIPSYKAGQKVYLKMQMLANKFQCAYSLDEKKWQSVGGELDGKHLSTKVAGGYIGAYFGLYSYAKSPAKAMFDWAEYKEIKP